MKKNEWMFISQVSYFCAEFSFFYSSIVRNHMKVYGCKSRKDIFQKMSRKIKSHIVCDPFFFNWHNLIYYGFKMDGTESDFIWTTIYSMEKLRSSTRATGAKNACTTLRHWQSTTRCICASIKSVIFWFPRMCDVTICRMVSFLQTIINSLSRKKNDLYVEKSLDCV